MPLRVGIDIVEIADVEDSLATFGDAFLARVFTPAEVAACDGGRSTTGLATLFAAKEASIKALGADDEGFAWTAIEIRRQEGAFSVQLGGPLAGLARLGGMRHIDVSAASTGTYASAVAVAELAPDTESTVEG